MSVRKDGGYCVILLYELLNVTWAVREKVVSSDALRVFLGAKLLVEEQDSAQYTKDELEEYCSGVGQRRLEKALFELEAAGFMSFVAGRFTFAERLHPEAAWMLPLMRTKYNRPIPLPRPILRALIAHRSAVEVIAAIGQLIHCLFKKASGNVNAEGCVKGSALAWLFQISQDAVKAARRWLVRLGFITPVKVHQNVLNACGARYRVCLEALGCGGMEAHWSAVPVCLHTEPFPENTPPIKTSTTSKLVPSRKTTRSKKNPKKWASGHFFRGSNGPGYRNVTDEDLRNPERRELLRMQLVASGLLRGSTGERVNFEAACFYASQLRDQDVRKSRAAIMMGIVRKKLWSNIPEFIRNQVSGCVNRAVARERAGVFRADKAPKDTARARVVVASCKDKLERLRALCPDTQHANKSATQQCRPSETYEVQNFITSQVHSLSGVVGSVLQKCFTESEIAQGVRF